MLPVYFKQSYYVAFVVLLGTLSAIGPGKSNLPFALFGILLIILSQILYPTSTFTLFIKPRYNTFLFYSFPCFFLFLFLYSASFYLLGFSDFNSAFDTSIFAISWFFYILFFSSFDFTTLLKGFFIGIAPFLFFQLFLELPLFFISRSSLDLLRNFLGLRSTVSFALIGFFEEPSHLPALSILAIPLAFFVICNSYLFPRFYLKISILAILLLSWQLGGMYIFSFIFPIFLFLLCLFLMYVFKSKIPISFLSNFLYLIIVSVFLALLSLAYLVQKFVYVFSISDHSTASRLLAFVSGVYDAFTTCPLGCISLYRLTRYESAIQLLNFPFLDFSGLVNANLLFVGLLPGQYTPVYSLIGFLFSESGLFVTLFFIPLLLLGVKSLSLFLKLNLFQSSLFSSSLSYRFFSSLFLVAPLCYFLNMMLGYPRSLPFAVLSFVITDKFFRIQPRLLSLK